MNITAKGIEMKILCVADHIDPLVYSDNIKERFNDVSLILGAGDLPLDYYEYIISCLNKPLYFVFGNHNLKRYHLFRPKSTDPMDVSMYKPKDKPSGIYENAFGSQYIGGKVVNIKKHKLLIAGLGGSYRYNKGPNQYTEFTMFMNILKIIPRLWFNRIFRGRYLDILLTHAPPRGIHDKDDPCHRGFSIFLWFMKNFRPRYLIHGHIHLYDSHDVRKSIYMETTIMNCYDHLILDYKEGDHHE